MENKEIRRKAKAAGVPFWKIAMKLGISEPTMTRLMRLPLSKETEEKISKIIEDLSKEGE